MQLKKDEIIQNFLYGILLSSFLILYFLLSINNRPAADDFFYLRNFQDLGWRDSVIFSWESWVTRWTSILLLNVIFSLYILTGNFLFFHIITLLMLCFALYRFAIAAIEFALLHLHNRYRSLHRIANLPRYSRFTVLVVIMFFFLCSHAGETFFWVTSTAMYLWSFIALCLLVSELLKPGQGFVSYLICIVTAAFIGGAAEAISLPFFFLLTGFLIFQVISKSLKPTTIVSLVILAASIIVSYAGEGRALRQEALPEFNLLSGLVSAGKTIANAEVSFFRDRWIYVVLFFIAWTGLAVKIAPGNFFTGRRIMKAVVIYVIFCIVLIVPASLILNDVLPYRAWILLTFLNCICLAVAGIFTGLLIGNPLLLKWVSSAALLVLAGLFVVTIIQQKEIAGKYAQAVDSRMQFLTTLVDPYDSTTVILEQLPESGFLTSAEISPDTADFRNNHLKNYLRLSAPLRIR